MEQPTETATPQPDEAIPPLADEIRDVLLRLRPRDAASAEEIDQACRDQASAIMELLNERGHYLPGCPPAARILQDAQSFAGKLTLSNLALRLLNMLAWSNVETPETRPARQWLDDYLEGKNHGPVGHPMLWPVKLPGICHLLTQWGFQPTPTLPPYVARALPHPTQQ